MTVQNARKQHAKGIVGAGISDEFLLREHQVQRTGDGWWHYSFCCITISERKNMLVSRCAYNSDFWRLLNQQCYLLSVHNCCGIFLSGIGAALMMGCVICSGLY